jgi:hypothetical protein
MTTTLRSLAALGFVNLDRTGFTRTWHYRECAAERASASDARSSAASREMSGPRSPRWHRGFSNGHSRGGTRYAMAGSAATHVMRAQRGVCLHKRGTVSS